LRQEAAYELAAHVAMLVKARNREYFRDRAAFGWNFLFPFLIIAGFGLIFGGKELSEYKVGVFPLATHSPAGENLRIAAAFGETRYLQFVPIASLEEGLTKLNRHKIDFLVKNDPASRDYWVNDASPKGYIIERLFNDSLRCLGRPPGPRAEECHSGGPNSLHRLAFSGDPGDEHDVQRPLGGRLRGGALPQKRGPQAPQGHPPDGHWNTWGRSCSRGSFC
jgi:hypothetical protein